MMMKVMVPFLGANDDHCALTEWLVENGAKVSPGQAIVTVESTKSSIEVEAPREGYVYKLASRGDRLSVGDLLFVVADKPESELEVRAQLNSPDPYAQTTPVKLATKKAEILAARLGIDLRAMAGRADGVTITENMVENFVKFRTENAGRLGFQNPERVGILGGVSGGGALIVIDAILRNPHQRPVAIFDRDPEFRGKTILGVPVVGDLSELTNGKWKTQLDSIVIAFNRDLQARSRTFFELKDFVFGNVIDPKVRLGSKVVIGCGNIILGDAFIGACSVIGNNNFISAGVHLEHGNIVGDHCGFGPGVFTSGNVRIGSGVRFATGIFVEPSLNIGDWSIISSGSVIRQSVPSHHSVVVKSSVQYRKIDSVEKIVDDPI